MRKHWVWVFIAGLAGFPAARTSAAATPPNLAVFAATPLTDPLQEIGTAYAQETGQTIVLTFAASASLAQRIEAGAAADVFFPADTDSMEYVQKRNLIDPKSRRDLLHNRLVLIARATNPVHLSVDPGFNLAAALGKGRLAIVNPETVALGRYARYALISLGVWNSVSDHLALANDVRVAMASVAQGEAPLGIVYETDARKDKSLRIVGTFPANAHPPIVYPVALTLNAKAGAARFVEFLRGPQGREIFRRYGFVFQ